MLARVAASAGAVVLLGAMPARAQNAPVPITVGVPFCNGTFVVDRFYNDVKANGSSSVVDYMMQLRNISGNPSNVLVSFIHQDARNALIRSPSRIPRYGSVTLRLGQEVRPSATGAGAKSPQQDVPFLVRFRCE